MFRFKLDMEYSVFGPNGKGSKRLSWTVWVAAPSREEAVEFAAQNISPHHRSGPTLLQNIRIDPHSKREDPLIIATCPGCIKGHAHLVQMRFMKSRDEDN